MQTIVVTPSEMAVIFGVNPRTIKNLETIGIVIRVGPAKLDLLKSTRNYLDHYRRIMTGANTADAKKAALEALTNLRDSQRRAIELKSKDYLLVSDACELFEQCVSEMRKKVLDFPAKCTRSIQDSCLPLTLKNAVNLEDTLDHAVDQLLRDLMQSADEKGIHPPPPLGANATTEPKSSQHSGPTGEASP